MNEIIAGKRFLVISEGGGEKEEMKGKGRERLFKLKRNFFLCYH